MTGTVLERTIVAGGWTAELVEADRFAPDLALSADTDGDLWVLAFEFEPAGGASGSDSKILALVVTDEMRQALVAKLISGIALPKVALPNGRPEG